MTINIPKFKIESEYTAEIVNSGQHVYPKGILSSAFKRMWDEGYTGKNIRVAVLDTGIDGNVPDLRGKVVYYANLTGEPLQESHGTHVAGTIAANGWLIGGAPDVSLLDIKILGRNGGSIENIIKGIGWAVDNGASVINMSLGTSILNQSSIDQLSNAINNAFNRGCICVAAAGNEGTSLCTTDPYEYPASIERAESIAACDVGESLDNFSLATFSNENNQVDIAACGVNVLSTTIGGNYAVYSGTSMATPHVSAMAALFGEYLRKTQPSIDQTNFAHGLISLLYQNVREVNYCGTTSVIKIKGKDLLKHTITSTCVNTQNVNPLYNIGFGRGFLRYKPNEGPVIPPNGQKYYNSGIFLGYQVNNTPF
jgi:major intracellular serine protease